MTRYKASTQETVLNLLPALTPNLKGKLAIIFGIEAFFLQPKNRPVYLPSGLMFEMKRLLIVKNIQSRYIA